MKKIILGLAVTLQLLVAVVLSTSIGFAANYSECAYGVGDYSNCDTTAASSGDLANTGENIWLFVSIGAILVGGGACVVLYRKRRRKPSKNSGPPQTPGL